MMQLDSKCPFRARLERFAACLALLWASPACIFVVGSGSDQVRVAPASERGARFSGRDSVQEAKLAEHIRVLASDEFEGRAPGTPGEDKTIAYLTRSFRDLGLEPGNPDGTYVQEVPLQGFTSKSQFEFTAGSKRIDFAYADEIVLTSRRQIPEIDVRDSDLVFVGYGVVAPEYQWDDFKDVDVRGKTIVVLVGDPAVPDPKDASKLDDATFKGRAMTYYGRWTYKFESAAERGAAGVLIVHETGPAGYGWDVVKNSWTHENFDIVASDKNVGRAAFEGWITLAKAHEIFAAAGQDFEKLKTSATAREFRPVPLSAKASVHVTNTLREVRSRNVVAKLTGSDEKLREEFVVYSAHWDHLGRDDTRTDDPIYNGAIDNASGTGGLLEIARVWASMRPRPPRSVLFLSVTAEEKGLLGSKWYATHPLVPLTKTLADINMDSLNAWGPTSDILAVGYGQSTLDEVLVSAAAARGRSVGGDPDPERGYYYRSDHFEFARVGVPALYADGGQCVIGQEPGYGKRRADEYSKNDYHQPSDEAKPDWRLSGAVLDLELLVDVGVAVASGLEWPSWKQGSEFRERRERALAEK